MTQDEIIEMARQAWADAGEGWVAKEWFGDRAKAFEAFAKLVAAKAIAGLESQEQNFCPRCGKRTNDIHTCTPPQRSESSGKPSAWVGMTEQEVWDAVRDTVGIMPSKAFRVYQAIEAELKEKNT